VARPKVQRWWPDDPGGGARDCIGRPYRRSTTATCRRAVTSRPPASVGPTGPRTRCGRDAVVVAAVAVAIASVAF